LKITAEQREEWKLNTADSPFNRWLNARVSIAGGGLDLERLYNLAKRYGIDKETAFSHLNPGQQRMIVGNMLRRRVSQDDYLDSSLDVKPQISNEDLSETQRLIRQAGVRELLILHSGVIEELRSRHIVRTSNSPVGDYAELLFSTAFGWQLAANSSAGFDAKSKEGVRYQIKSRRVTPWNPSRQLGGLRRLPERTFDVLACVLFDTKYRVMKALLLPHAVVSTIAKRVDHTNSWRVIADDKVWLLDGARDVTAEVSRASESF